MPLSRNRMCSNVVRYRFPGPPPYRPLAQCYGPRSSTYIDLNCITCAALAQNGEKNARCAERGRARGKTYLGTAGRGPTF